MVSEDDVPQIINTMSSATCDLDPIPTHLVKSCIQAFLPIITFIVNMSLNTAIMPNDLKKALITPIIKKLMLDPEILKNYRPISNVPFISKVIEKCVATQLTLYVTENNMACKWQSAYREGHSTETALICVFNDILLKLDNSQCVALVLLDLSAAFDTIDRSILIQRLKCYYGIKGTALAWIRSYLDNRTQSIQINKSQSSQHINQYGVPQGSVLGPLLFSLYTTPLGKIIEASGMQFHLYADDTQLYFSFDAKLKQSVNDHINVLKKCMEQIGNWMSTNYLKLNNDKTELIILGGARQLKFINFKFIEIGNIKIETSPTIRNIGVIMDSTLNMKAHINKLCRTCYMNIRNIWRIRENLDNNSTKTLVHALVISRLDCINGLYYGLPNYLILKIQKVQNAAARLVFKAGKRCHITPLLKELHWLPVKLRIEYKLLTLTFKCIHGGAPAYLNELITSYKPYRNLRSQETNLLNRINAQTSLGERAFQIAAPILWNQLPQPLRGLPSLNTFKSNLKTFIFQKHF